MTRALDPEIKAARALERAVAPLDRAARQRIVEWFVARQTGRPWLVLPRFREAGPVVDKPLNHAEEDTTDGA